MSEKRKSPSCRKYQLTPLQKSISIFAILGISFLFAGLFAITYFLFERADLVPYLTIYEVHGFTEGENWLVFVYGFILAVFLPFLLIWSLYRYYRLKNCSDLDTDIESMR